MSLLLASAPVALAAAPPAPPASTATGPNSTHAASSSASARRLAAERFLAQRGLADGHPALRSRAAANRAPGFSAAAALMRARRQAAVLLSAAGHAAGADGNPVGTTWSPAGPAQTMTAAFGKVTGRISSIAVDPADQTGNTVYIGATGGGVWRSTNGAAADPAAVTFSPLTDGLASRLSSAESSLSIGALTVQPGGTGVILAGTGDPNDALDSYWGSGLLRSTDSGATWTLIPQSNETFHSPYVSRQFMGEAFAGFAWSTASPNVVVAAVSESAEAANVNAAGSTSQAGVYYSTDAGATWWLATITDPGGAVVQSPKLPIVTTAAATSVVWNAVRGRFYAAVRFHGYYESADGINWARLASQPGLSLTATLCPSSYPSVACPIFRGALAVQPVSGDLFALTGDINNLNQGIWRDPCSAIGGSCGAATVNFQALPSQPLQDSSAVIAQADYNLWLAAVASSGDTLLYAGTEDIYRCSLAAGCAWRNATNVHSCASARVAGAQHAVDATFAGPSAAGLMYFGNDGGLWRSTDGVQQAAAPCSADDAAHFQSLNGGLGSLAEVVDLAADTVSPNILLAAQGAFGTNAATTAGETVWPQVLDGEGSRVAIDPQNPANWFAAATSGVGIHACTLGDACAIADFGTTVVGSAQVGGDGDALFQPAPWILDPQDSTRLIVGTCRVWRGPTSGGANWSASNALSLFLDGTGPNQATPVCTSDGVVRSLAGSGTASNPAGGQEVLYAGMAGSLDGGATAAGRIFSATVSSASDSSTIWTDLSESPVTNDMAVNRGQFNPGGFAVSSIAVDPHDTTGKTVYATVAGFGGNGIGVRQVYGSTDGGAHWLSMSSNLPNAPANSVAVDPNDANTLYVGLDVGVFVTHQVAACGVAGPGCWSAYGSGLPNVPVTKLSVFNGVPASLRAATFGRGVWQTGLAAMSTTATLTPAALTFADQALSTPSPPQPLALTNTGGLALQISGVTLSADYSETDNCGTSLASGANCTLQVTFNPSQVGARPGTGVVFGNVPGGQVSAVLGGNGTAGSSIVPLPTSLAFGNSAVGATTAAQGVTLSNQGGVSVTMTSETVTGDYQATANTCGAVLAAGAGCTVSIVFKPTTSGSRPGNLIVVDGAGTQTVPLTGTGQAGATDTLTPLSLVFAPQILDSASAAQAVTLTNSGDAALTLVAAAVTGDFTVVSGCGNLLAGHTSCVLNVAFQPQRAGPATGTLTVTDALHSQVVTLTGTGLAAAVDVLSPLALVFGAQALNSLSPAQSVTLTNSSGAALTLIAAQMTGQFVLNSGCTPTLQGHASCVFSVSYLPTVAGAETGTLVVTDANGSQTVTLSGTGIEPTGLTASPSSLNFGNVSPATTSPSQAVTFTSKQSTPISNLSFAIAGSYLIAADACPATLAAGASCAVQVVFAPTVSGSSPGTLTANSASSLTTAVVVPLSGTGQTGATDNLSPSTLDFGTAPLNSPSIVQQVTLTNSGDAVLSSIAATISGSFILESGCGPTLAAHSNCKFSMEFLPTTSGLNHGALVVVDSIQSQTVPLTGTGLAGPADALSPLSLHFGNQALNTPSAPQLVTLSNTGDTILSGIAVQLAGDFTMTNGCGATLPAKTSCIVTVAYLPTVLGAETGRLSVADALRTQTVALAGTGVLAPTDVLTPSSLTFFPQAIGTTSPPQPVTLANSGGAALTGIAASITGDFVLANGCGVTLDPGSNCIFNVSFMPTHTGVESGVLTVTDGIRTQTVTLNGPIQTPPTDTLAPPTLAFSSQTVDLPSAAQTVTMTNSGEATLTGITTRITGDFSVSDTCGAALAGQTSCTFSVIYTPTHSGSATGTLTVTDALQDQKVKLTGTGTSSGGGSLFGLLTANAVTATIQSGQTASYTVDVVPTPTASGTVALSCTGLPEYSSCTATPASVALIASGVTTPVSVQVATGLGGSAFNSAPAQPVDKSGARLSVALVLLGLVPLGVRGRRRLGAIVGTVILATAVIVSGAAMSGCGGVTVSTGGGHQNVTPPGTYQITVTGTDGSERHTAILTLVVQ